MLQLTESRVTVHCIQQCPAADRLRSQAHLHLPQRLLYSLTAYKFNTFKVHQIILTFTVTSYYYV